MTISEIQTEVHALAVKNGWYNPTKSIGEHLALIHSEVSEALEAYREGDELVGLEWDGDKPVGFLSEMADVVIRVMDVCEYLEMDLESAIIAKHKYNTTRPYRHGGKKV